MKANILCGNDRILNNSERCISTYIVFKWHCARAPNIKNGIEYFNCSWCVCLFNTVSWIFKCFHPKWNLAMRKTSTNIDKKTNKIIYLYVCMYAYINAVNEVIFVCTLLLLNSSNSISRRRRKKSEENFLPKMDIIHSRLRYPHS